MSTSSNEFDIHLRRQVTEAIRHYWNTRNSQAKNQGEAGKKDAGLRSAVTGGAQLDGFIDLIRRLLIESGLKDSETFVGRGDTIIPGFFRPTKAWDVVAVSAGTLVAAVEVKSQAGPSYGNNFNNRVEEAIGNAVDFWKAFEEGAYESSERPFLGYVMLLEDDEKSRAPVKIDKPHFKARVEFENASYARRYQLFCEKLLRERLYEGAAFLLSAKDAGSTGTYLEPSTELSFKKFAAALMGKGYAFSKGR